MQFEERRSHRLFEGSDLSRGQYQIWLGQKLDPQTPLYNMAFAFTILAAVDEAAFDRAFFRLMESSDALRTVVREREDGTPMREVAPSSRYRVEHLDLSDRPDPEKNCRSLLATRSRVPFDISSSMLDCALIKISDSHFVWFLNQHHLITDALSTALVFRRLGLFYEQELSGESVNDTPWPQFQEYVDHERGQREGENHREAPRGARGEAGNDSAPPLEFNGRPTPPGALSTERVTLDLGSVRSERLRKLANDGRLRSLSTDLSMLTVFSTALIAFLGRMTGSDRPVFGLPTSRRSSKRLQQTVGLLIELLPLGVDLGDHETFASLVAAVRQKLHGALAATMRGTNSSEETSKIGVVLNYVNAGFGTFAGAEVEAEWLHCGYCDRGHALRVHVHDFVVSGRFEISFDMATEVFDEEVRQGFLERFVRLVDAFVENPDGVIDDVELCSQHEHRELTRCRTGDAALEMATAVDQFAANARRDPERLAVVDGTQTLTARELMDRVDHLASNLRERGVQRGDRVVLRMRRSVDAVTSLLAVARIGACSVPMDPADPPLRQEMILEDASAALVIVDDAPLTGSIDQGMLSFSALLEEPVTGPCPEATLPNLDDPAYVIFTSGSTGRPKGVVVTHRNLANYLGWARRELCDGDHSSFPLFSSLSVDLTVTSIWLPLVAGGTVVVYREHELGAAAPILQVFEDDRVDVVKLTPTHLELAEDSIAGTRRLRTLVVGGENLRSALARSIHHAGEGRIRIINEYGPTEATVGCSAHVYDPSKDTGALVPVGRPADNTALYVLDGKLKPQPVGVAGEVFISGAGVSQGYLARPELTAERFLNDPFHSGLTMYRSGDLGRWNSQHELEIIGRVDRQVKLRGLRVEPAEIEAALVDMTPLRNCVVEAVPRLVKVVGNDPEESCVRCGLPRDGYPVTLNAEGVCNHCIAYDAYHDMARAYFRTPDEMRELLDGRSETTGAEYDCIMMLSGGKDSTYALCKLVDMGLKVLAYTFDNGFISETAKQNMRRIVDALGVDLIEGTTPAMNEVFVDSLDTFGTVCNGCFKVIFVLVTQLAREKGIRHVVTGLSRGQIFATRLADLYREGIDDPDSIDEAVLRAKMAYHRMDDAVSRLLDTEIFAGDEIFEQVQFLDFYRYHDVPVDDMFTYLRGRVPWKRPSDTGCSTNCLINDVGIYVHTRARGFHNYAFPYSWEVRLGHKNLDKAREQLNATMDMDKVLSILEELGYPNPGEKQAVESSLMLVAFYTADAELDVAECRDRLTDRLPPAMMPAELIRVDEIPMTAAGKVDRRALRDIADRHFRESSFQVPPSNPTEATLTRIWAAVLGVESVGITDDFFRLGGDSIMVMQIVSRARDEGLHFAAKDLFSHPTVAALALRCRVQPSRPSDHGPTHGAVPFTPIQRWYLEQQPDPRKPWNQAVWLEVEPSVTATMLDSVMTMLVKAHPTLRLRLERDEDGWRQHIDRAAPAAPVRRVDVTELQEEEVDVAIAAAVTELHESLDAGSPPLLRAALFDVAGQGPNRLFVAAHHLAVDTVSWAVIVGDMQTACEQLGRGDGVQLASPTTSFKAWAESLTRAAASSQMSAEAEWWIEQLSDAEVELPAAQSEGTGSDGRVASHTVELSTTETELLTRERPRRTRSSVQEIMCATVLRGIRRWGATGSLMFDVESHGRQPLDDSQDLSRTVGWFTSIYPIVVSLDEAVSSEGALRAAKNSLRNVSRSGICFGLLRYLCPDESLRDRLAELHRPVALVNYLGRMDSLCPSGHGIELVGVIEDHRDFGARRPYLVEVDSWVVGGKLTIRWTYDPNRIATEAVVRLAEETEKAVAEATGGETEAPVSSFVPSDFPAAGLDQGELDDLMAEFGDLPE